MSKAAKDIFLSAVEIADVRERAQHLDQACGDDASLRKRVEALLRAQADPDSFLDHPAVAPSDAISGDGTQADDTPLPGRGAAVVSSETITAAAVKNEHVVGIYDVERDAQPPYLAMEMIDGVSLQDKIDKHGPLGVNEI